MTSKEQELYAAILAKIRSLISAFLLLTLISDLETAPRNALREIYPTILNSGCGSTLPNVFGLKAFARNLMAIPFLPASLIRPTYTFLQVPFLPNLESDKMELLCKYSMKRSITQVDPKELSIYEAEVTTNNAAESYHAKLKSIIKTPLPRTGNFVTTLNNIMEDTDNQIGKLRLGHDISGPRKSKHVLEVQQREIIQEKFKTGVLTPW